MSSDVARMRQQVFEDRYALRTRDGVLLETSPEQMFERVARAIGGNSFDRAKYHAVLSSMRFVPAGRILSAAGSTSASASFYNCFVIGIEPTDRRNGADSRDGIMSTMRRMVEINCRGGGVGINWSTLRPSGEYVHGVHGTSSGPCAWMEGADGLANQVRQGGTRTAALMFMLDDWHPDIMPFIQRGKRFQRANYSVCVSDEFMQALQHGETWDLCFPDTSCPEYAMRWDGDLRAWRDAGLPVVVHATLPAGEIWSALIDGAWETGNPGVAFMGQMRKSSNTSWLESINCVNPCGEQPLPPNGCCNLGAINLMAHYRHGGIDMRLLSDTIACAVRFLDDVIDAGSAGDADVDYYQQNVRRIGLGTMGLADVLLQERIAYGSERCMLFIDQLYQFIRDEAYRHSALLAQQHGPAPALEGHIDEFLGCRIPSSLPDHIKHLIEVYGVRNLGLLTQAPTGTTGMLAGVSSGIEPVFAWEYTRADATGTYEIVHPAALQFHLGSPWMVTARDLSWQEHVDVQARIQLYVDASISKTVNLPADVPPLVVSQVYQYAYRAGCKGITVYRDASGEGVLVEGKCKSCAE